MDADTLTLLDRLRHTSPARVTAEDLPPGLLDRLAALTPVAADDFPDDPVDVELPESIGPYVVTGLLGRGGMGVVYRAIDPALGRPVAVKVMTAGLYADPAARARFNQEGRAVAALRHDHIVPVYAAHAPADGPPYLVMPVIEGPTLAEAARRGLTPRESADTARHVADALAAAHAAGLVHCDVKPANILLDSADGRAKLTDFGLARITEGGITIVGDPITAGTPEYLAPEQAANPTATDGRADVYSLGVVLYECLTGVPPFRGPLRDVLHRHATEDAVRPRRLVAGIPADLETVTLKCLEKDPARRYQTAAAVRDDLGRFLEGRPTVARPVGPIGRTRRWARRNPLRVALIGVTLIGAAVSAAGWYRAATAAAAARTEKAIAIRQATVAEERTGVAVAALNTVVLRAKELPEFTPGALKLKRELTEAALEHVRELTAGADNVPGGTRAALKAHRTLGDTLYTLGKTDEAQAEWAVALRQAEAVAAADPADTFARRVQTDLHGKLGSVRTLLGDTATAASHYSAAGAILDVLHAADPNNAELLQNLAVVHSGKSDVARATGDGVAALSAATRALEFMDRSVSLDPRPASLRTLHAMNGRVAYAHLARYDFPAAERYFRAAMAVAAAGREKLPDDRSWQQLYFGGLMELATVELALGRFKEAEAGIRAALAWLEPAAAAAPDDALLARQVGLAWIDLGRVALGRSQFADADEFIGKGIGLLDGVGRRTKNSALVRGDLFRAQTLRVLDQLRLARHAEAADSLTAALAALGPAPATVTARVRVLSDAIRQVPKALADPAFTATLPPEVGTYTAAYRAAALGWRGEHDTARREIAAVRKNHPADPLILQLEAVILGNSAAASTDLSRKAEFTKAGVDALLITLRADPAVFEVLAITPEWAGLRNEPAFQNGLRGLTVKP